MALIDEVQSRYSTQYLRNLTNPDNAAASSVNTTTLALAVTDAEAEFEEHTGTVLDDTDDMHVNLGVEGVIYKLMQRKSASDSKTKKARDDWHKRLEHFDVTYGSRARIDPDTTGVGAPSAEQRTTETVRPKFNDPLFDDLVPTEPKAGSRNDPDDPD